MSVLRIVCMCSLVSQVFLMQGAAYAQVPPAIENGEASAEGAPPAVAPLSAIIPEENRIKSLLFTPEEISDIRYALNIYRKHSGGAAENENFDEEDFLNRLTGLRKAPETNRFFVYPQFFLESLVYHSPNNWAIWINNQKITQDSPKESTDLTVLEIDKDKVQIKWRPVSMQKVNEMWARIPNKEVVVDKRKGAVIFTIKPNQTFSSYVMHVLEGKMRPVTVDTHAISVQEEEEILNRNSEEPPAETPAAEPAPVEEVKPAPAPQESREGLSGLIGAYSHIGNPDNHNNPPTPQEKKP